MLREIRMLFGSDGQPILALMTSVTDAPPPKKKKKPR